MNIEAFRNTDGKLNLSLANTYVEELKAKKKKLERKLIRNKEKSKEYESSNADLSVHGYWSKGYFAGAIAKLEDVIDDITDELEPLEKEIKREEANIDGRRGF